MKRALGFSTPPYDEVATRDTITLIRSVIRALLKVADTALEAELRAVLSIGDDYLSLSKPQIDWDDRAGRELLIDSRANDGYVCLNVLDERKLSTAVTEVAELLATVLGQDLEPDAPDGQAACSGSRGGSRRTAPSPRWNPQARHGHKTVHRGFDGYKGHVAVDPASETVTDTVVSAGNVGDAAFAEELVTDLPKPVTEGAAQDQARAAQEPQATVYDDSAYGSGPSWTASPGAGLDSRCKTQPPTAPRDLFAKDAFYVDLQADTARCPNAVTAPIRRGR